MAIATTTLILSSLLAAQTASGVVSDRKNAKAARKEGEFQGKIYDQAAEDAIARGEETAHHMGADARILTGAQKASMAAAGIDIGSGSAADVVSSDQRRESIDEATLRTNAAREAFGFTEQGRLARMGGRNQAAAYNSHATSTLLSGAADLYGVYRASRLNRQPGDTTSGGGAGTTLGGYRSGTARY